MSVRRTWALAALAVAGCCAVLSPRAASAQGTPPSPLTVSFTLAAGSFGNCPMALQLDVAGKSGVIVLPGGRTIVTAPAQSVTITNLDAPSKTVTLNITGAQHTSQLPDGSALTVATGRNLLGDPVAGLVLAIGRFTFVTGADGSNVQPLSGTGQVIDVCAMVQ
jgi:hypothetical protein